MKIEIEIPDRAAQDMLAYCEKTGLALSEQARKLVEDWYYTEKYGDLNKILNTAPKEEPRKGETKPSEPQKQSGVNNESPKEETSVRTHEKASETKTDETKRTRARRTLKTK